MYAARCVVFWIQCWLCCTWFILVLVVFFLVFSLDVREEECMQTVVLCFGSNVGCVVLGLFGFSCGVFGVIS